jgi:hypothetical protein
MKERAVGFDNREVIEPHRPLLTRRLRPVNDGGSEHDERD